MAWTPKYVNGKLSIVPDANEEFAEGEINRRLCDIENDIAELIQDAKDGKFQTVTMLKVFARIGGMLGRREFIVLSGPPDPDATKRWDEMVALDARLNAELEAAR